MTSTLNQATASTGLSFFDHYRGYKLAKAVFEGLPDSLEGKPTEAAAEIVENLFLRAFDDVVAASIESVPDLLRAIDVFSNGGERHIDAHKAARLFEAASRFLNEPSAIGSIQRHVERRRRDTLSPEDCHKRVVAIREALGRTEAIAAGAHALLGRAQPTDEGSGPDIAHADGLVHMVGAGLADALGSLEAVEDDALARIHAAGEAA